MQLLVLFLWAFEMMRCKLYNKTKLIHERRLNDFFIHSWTLHKIIEILFSANKTFRAVLHLFKQNMKITLNTDYSKNRQKIMIWYNTTQLTKHLVLSHFCTIYTTKVGINIWKVKFKIITCNLINIRWQQYSEQYPTKHYCA